MFSDSTATVQSLAQVATPSSKGVTETPVGPIPLQGCGSWNIILLGEEGYKNKLKISFFQIKSKKEMSKLTLQDMPLKASTNPGSKWVGTEM